MKEIISQRKILEDELADIIPTVNINIAELSSGMPNLEIPGIK